MLNNEVEIFTLIMDLNAIRLSMKDRTFIKACKDEWKIRMLTTTDQIRVRSIARRHEDRLKELSEMRERARITVSLSEKNISRQQNAKDIARSQKVLSRQIVQDMRDDAREHGSGISMNEFGI